MSADIRFCTKSDIIPLMDFIDKHWSKNHILSRNRELLEWQHSGTQGREYDFVAAFNGSEVLGCLGFILTSRFDTTLIKQDTLWFALWIVKENTIGLRLFDFISKNVDYHSIGTVGINSLALNIYNALGYKTGAMEQHYVLHPYIDKFNLAGIPKDSPRISNTIDRKSVPKLNLLSADDMGTFKDTLDDLWPKDTLPYKSFRYYINRFINHPFYNYKIYSIEHNGIVTGLLVTRLIEAKEGSVLRLVDLYGPSDALRGIAEPLQYLLEILNAEYADFYQAGINEKSIKESGLLTLQSIEGDTIIPNFFEPFVKKNVRINWAHKLGSNQKIFVCKGDGDQDRPN